MSEEIDIESVCAAILKKFPGKIGDMNVVAARAANLAAQEEERC
jgi:Pyruvate/2-oxoacid:ferredoxin oxidoreductase gamma subunit